MIILTIVIQLSLCQIQHNTWQGSLYSASLTASKLITTCRWRSNGQWICSHSISPAELLPRKNFNKDSADLRLLSQVSCASTWTQSSKLTNALFTWATLESQPITLQTSPAKFGQSSSAFAKQDWNWQLEVPFRCQTSWSPRKNNFTRKNFATSSENPQFSRQI